MGIEGSFKFEHGLLSGDIIDIGFYIRFLLNYDASCLACLLVGTLDLMVFVRSHISHCS